MKRFGPLKGVFGRLTHAPVTASPEEIIERAGMVTMLRNFRAWEEIVEPFMEAVEKRAVSEWLDGSDGSPHPEGSEGYDVSLRLAGQAKAFRALTAFLDGIEAAGRLAQDQAELDVRRKADVNSKKARRFG